MKLKEVASKPFTDQKSGTAGLRKKVGVFQQEHYLENFLQSIFNVDSTLKGGTLVIGGDGRYHNRTAIQTAISMAAANGVSRVLVGQGGLLSTPAASNVIRQQNAAGGFVLTASHNPAGKNGDFGIKYNVAGGGQATEDITGQIYEQSKQISSYRIAEGIDADIDRVGTQSFGEFELEILDGVEDYAQLMQRLFDFDQIKNWFSKGNSVRFDAMHAVTGPYARRLLVEMLGAPEESVQNAIPLEDFGGGHPDPNLIYAKPLVDLMYSDSAPTLGAASDGDGDRNMILGKGIFISPGDSLAMLCAHLHRLPGYKQGLAGVARSMPTCRAVDQVAKAAGFECFETPTGWKFFANLLDAGRITLCGEESFGTSSAHVREKDGVWAVLAWINILAATGKSVSEIAIEHWRKYGRHYYVRHDYEDLSAEMADEIMQALIGRLDGLVGKEFGEYRVSQADEFSYQDPIDNSVANHQGIRIVFGESARIILRKSGTGTQGATLRLYLERYENALDAIEWETNQALTPLVDIAEQIIMLKKISGRSKPSVIT